MKVIINNKVAVIGMPVYLMVAIITAGIIIGLFALSIHNTIANSQNEQIKKEIEKIITEAENMFEYADSGTLVTVSVDFSDALNFVVFGSMPKNGAAEPKDFTLVEEMSNNYYFVTNDGTISSYKSNARFSSEDISKIAVFGSGSFDLKLELEKVGGKTYVKISKW